MKINRFLSIALVALVAWSALPFDLHAQKKSKAEKAEVQETVFPEHETAEQKNERMQWWSDARFGMFIHWGLYSMSARHEWVMRREKMTPDDEMKYFTRFNPDLYDPHEWARYAKAAGMKYAVLTTKHHEGFCLFDSGYTEFKATNTPAGRDLVREFLDAFREEGIKVGFYYSLLDWNHPDYVIDHRHPMYLDEGASDEEWDKINEGRDMEKYRQYMKNQITELLTQYGKIDIMWYDFSFAGPHGKGAEDWGSEEILKLTRTLQPGIIVNGRLGITGCDFDTPEQYKVDKCVEENGQKVHWETCQTFSGSWGYFRDETTWKSVPMLIELLVETVSKCGNLILNVGPTARGDFDYRAKERLDGIAEWMHYNCRAIYGCTEAPAGFETPANSLLTYNPSTNTLYISLLDYPMGKVKASFMDKVEYAQFLHDGSEIKFDSSGFDVPILKPHSEIPVIEVFLKK